jgi:hypothetical protein
MKLIFTILFLVSCTFNLFAQPDVTKEEYEVYAAVFEKRFEKSELDKTMTRLAILENTIDPDYSILNRYINNSRTNEYLTSPEPNGSVKLSDWEESITDLKTRDNNFERLKEQFSIKYNYNTVSKSEIDLLLEEGKKANDEYYKKCEPCSVGNPFVWQPFHKKYRNSEGYYSFSRVGFSKDKKTGFVFLKTVSGDQGWSTFYVVGKANENWKVLKYFGSGWIN